MTGSVLPWSWRVLIALVAAGLAALLSVNDAGSLVDDLIYDLHLSHWTYPPDDDVVIVAIDDRSLAEIGQWPWPRDIHAGLLDHLSQAGVRGVALDLILAEPDRSGAKHDRTLAAAMAHNGHVVLPVVPTVPQQSSPPIEVLPTQVIAEHATALGHTDVELDAEGAVRGLYLRAGLGEARWPALALALLELDPKTKPQTLPGLRRPAGWGGSAYQWVRDYHVRTRYAGPPGSFAQVSYSAVLDGQVPAALLRNRWVIVGVTATGLAPSFITPMSDRRMPGAEYQANVLEMLLHDRAIVPLAPTWQALLTGLMVLVVTLCVLSPGVYGPLLMSLGGAVATLLGSIALLRVGSLWFAPATAIGAIALAYLGWMVRHLLLWRRQAHVDTLTQLANRRRFDHVLESELVAARRARSPLSLMLIDLDHFKAYNDTEGHRAGDKLLVQVAQLIRAHARRSRDLAARFGGDEFAVILPDTPERGAALVAEAILVDMRALDLRYGAPGAQVQVSLSIGIHSGVPDASSRARMLFDHADAALYRAKENGRDGYAHTPAGDPTTFTSTSRT